MKTIYLDSANFLWERKFEQRIPFPRKGKPKSIRLNKFRSKQW